MKHKGLVAAALTDALQQEGQAGGGSTQGVHGRHVHHVGDEGENLHVPKGAAPWPRADALTHLRVPPSAVPGGQRGALGEAPCTTQAMGGLVQCSEPPTHLYVATKSVSSSGSGARAQEQFTACG